MKCSILHESAGRLRVRLHCPAMTLRQADVLEYYLRAVDGVTEVKVYDRTRDAVVCFACGRGDVIASLAAFSFPRAEAMDLVPEHTSRALNREFEDKLIMTVARRMVSRLFLPAPVTTALAVIRSVKYIWEGLSALWHGRLSVAVLDATAVTVSMARGDFATAGSVMFMLRLGEILEEWTHKKSVADLAGAMSLHVDQVWLQTGGTEVLTPIDAVRAGDRIVIRTGSVIPLDGRVSDGEATVNQSSMTGESMPVAKRPGSYVYAGTVVEEGQCVVCVEKASGGGRYDRIVRMIEESEKLKSTAEDRASRLADRLVPYTLGGTALTYLLTRNVTKTLSVLMVDFSCALKLAIPIAVLSAMRECSGHHISVKGGRFMEAVAQADTIVFDKTGTLTYATPRVAEIVPFGGRDPQEMLRLAACLEEHYPHSMANAVVDPGPVPRGVPLPGAVCGGSRHLQHGGGGKGPHRQRPLRVRGRGLPGAGGGGREVPDPLPCLFPPVPVHRRGAGRRDLHPRSPAPGGPGRRGCPSRLRHWQGGDDDRRQPPDRPGRGPGGGGGRRVCRGTAGGQGRLHPQ